MKHCIVSLALAACLAPVPASAETEVVDTYRISMRLQVPEIVNNMASLGRRKFRLHRLDGFVEVAYSDPCRAPRVRFASLTNRSYRVAGSPVTYLTVVDSAVWAAVGDNRTDRFKTASVAMRIEANPSYNIGDDEPDNTLVLWLAGRGSSGFKRIVGYAAGQLGCGCRAYGHVSPTRIAYVPYVGSAWWYCPPLYSYPAVTDIASCYGNWTMKFVRREEREAPVDTDDGM